MFDLESLFGFCPNRLPDAVAMLRTPLKGAQHQHVQCSLHELNAVLRQVLSRHPSSRESTRTPSAVAELLLVACSFEVCANSPQPENGGNRSATRLQTEYQTHRRISRSMPPF